MVSLSEALGRVLERALPLAAVEVPLTEAQGLVLAEPLAGDVDLPPFDRACFEGYAARAADAAEPGARLNVVVARRVGWGSRRSSGPAEITIGPGECARVAAGDPMPVGADTVVAAGQARVEPDIDTPHEVVVLKRTEAGHGVVARGHFLRAGVELAAAGTRLRLPMVGLLAASGCVHPVCHRRVRVAVLAVGDHLVGPGEAPVMHRERNAGGATAVAPCLHWGATAHDLGVVAERDLAQALDRALTAPIVVVLGAASGAIPKALRRAKVESAFERVALDPGDSLSYGVLRDGSGLAAHHIFHMAPGPIGVMTGIALLLGPLIARLHGGPATIAPPLRAVWDGPERPATDDRLHAVPVTLAVSRDARLHAAPVVLQGRDDLAGFARADALALLPERSGPWVRGEVIDVVPLGCWPPGAPAPSAGA